MFALQAPGGRGDGCDVQLPSDVPDAIALKRGARPAGIDAVAVGPRPRVPPGVEPWVRLDGAADGDIGGEEVVQPTDEPGGRQRRPGVKRGDLAECVRACIGPAGERRTQAVAGEFFERGLQAPLDARAVILVLRAAIGGPVVLEQQGDPAAAGAASGGRAGLCVQAPPSTSSSWAMGAASPLRGPSLMIRV